MNHRCSLLARLATPAALAVLAAGLSCALAQAPGAGGPGGAGPHFSPLMRKFMKARNAGDKSAAIAILKQGVAEGDADAETQLAEEYRGGDSELAGAVPIDFKKSFELTKAALGSGKSRVFTDIGILYLKGQGVDKNPALALQYLLKATNAGDRKAPRYVGIIYEFGYGAPVSYANAAKYYQIAAARQDITGACLLGSLYERGLGVPQNYDTAEQLYLKSASRGDIIASAGMVGLGHLYETRTDGKQNRQTAIAWYQKAAVQNNPVAKQELTRLASNGAPLVLAVPSLCLSANW